MSENLKQDLEEMLDQMLLMGSEIPMVMQSYQQLVKASSSSGEIPSKYKELTSIAVSVVARCDGCILFHVAAAKRLGASRREVAEILAVAIELGGGPAAVYSGKALKAYDNL